MPVLPSHKDAAGPNTTLETDGLALSVSLRAPIVSRVYPPTHRVTWDRIIPVKVVTPEQTVTGPTWLFTLLNGKWQETQRWPNRHRSPVRRNVAHS